MKEKCHAASCKKLSFSDLTGALTQPVPPSAALFLLLKEAPHEALSVRELQVLRLIAMGRTLKEISTELTVSEKTVATYRAHFREDGVGH